MESVLSPIVEKTINFAVDPIIRQLVYILRCSQNVVELFASVESLKLEKESIDRRCDQAEKNVQNIEPKVKEWSRKVDELKTEVEKFRNDEGHRKTGLSNALFLFPYLWHRHRLGRQAKKIAEAVQNLIDESANFNEVSYTDNVTSNDFTFSNVGYMAFASRESTVEKIIAKLEDSSVRMIGLHGGGGMGKSTLIRAIAKKAKDKKLFNVVAISEITANPDPLKIQEDIAYPLGLRLEGEGQNARAPRLMKRLKQEKENTLIILDDLWDRLDLNKLGIPLDDIVDDKQDPEDANKEKSLVACKGFKILLTSRDKNVLTDKMEVKSTFCVEELDDEDALRLFQKQARIQGEMSKWKQEIVKKYCAGLPMAIVTVGRALRDKNDSEWEKLKNQDLVGVQNSMEISVKMSYDRLENEELKSIFFLCAQMGHQPLIMDLVKYCFCLGILKGVYSLGEARGRISTSIQKLKDSGLVLDGSSSIHFNMHDLVRDAALSIAHKEENVFTLRNGKLDDWPELERCTSISIRNSHIIDEIPEEINCPQLKFFQIDSDDPSLKIPDRFFKGMKKLKVLMLTGIQLSSFPSSIESLSDLRMLCFERCTLDGELSIIGKLKKLRILSFYGSRIENLPAELKDLDKLQLLDISNCSIVKRIPHNLISRLTSLEELYVRKTFDEVSVEGERNQSQISFLSELKHLHQLQVVDLSIPCAEVFPKEFFFDKLNDYKIEIGNFQTLSIGDFRMPSKYEKFKSLALELKDDTDDIHSHKGIKLLFTRVENLLLGELNGVQDVINELNLDGFPYLKHLSIVENPDIKYIINSKDLFYPLDVFPKLESLCLYELRKIEMIYFSSGTEMICFSPFTDCSFTKLKTINVEKCDQLKNLFSYCMVKLLASLETIGVFHCGSLEEIVKIPDNSDKIEFLKLKSLSLESLSSFTSFYTTVEGSSTNRDQIQITVIENEHSDMAPPLFGELIEIPNLENLNLISMNKIQKIWSDQPLSNFCFQNLTKLVVEHCHNLRYLCSLSVASSLRKLKSLFVRDCEMMEKIFSTEGNDADKVCVFPKLEEIHLDEMGKLTDIWQAEVSRDSFSGLTSVHIYSCNKLVKIFPSHMEGWFASLNSLNVYDCESVAVIFEIKDSQQVDASGGIDTNLQVLDVWRLPNLKEVWSRDPGGILNFKKLQSIQVSRCKSLKNVFPASVAKDVPKLEYMSVKRCGEIVEIVACEDGSETNTKQLVFPELTYMDLGYLKRIQYFYRGRNSIDCPKLNKLTLKQCKKKLKTFPTGETTNKEDEAVFSAEKIFPNLEYLDIDFDEAQKWLLSNTVKHRMHRLKELRLREVNDGERLCQILYRMPNLEKLYLRDAEHLLKESSKSRLGTVIQLKELVLSGSKIKDIGFEREPVLQRLELLSIERCNKLTNLGHPSISLAYLTDLKVKYCDGLRNLMASSTAKSMVHLKSMKISECKELEEIVTNEGNEEELILFGKLNIIELEGLEKLKSFCSYKNCEFEFPSLGMLIVSECPMMQTFSEGRARATSFQNIVEGKWEAKWLWKADLNATIQDRFNKVAEYARTVSSLSLGDSPLIQEIWLGSRPIQNGCFSNLNSLTVYGCQFLSDVVLPFFLLPFLTNLQRLTVWDCGSVKSIFDVKREITTMGLGAAAFPLPFSLKYLTLGKLPKLENVWNEDPHGILSMQPLQEVSVYNCECLLYLFTSSTAKSLTQLKSMEIEWCNSIEEVVSKEGDESHGNEIIFPQLNCLKLEKLRKLRSFYRGSLLSLPSLEELSVIDCEWMETLCPGTLKADKLLQVKLGEWYKDPIPLENHDLNSTMREAFREKLLNSAHEERYIELKDSPLQEIWLRLDSLHIPDSCFSDLRTLIVDGCHFLTDAVLPFYLLPLLPQLESLVVRNCDFVQIIFDVKCLTQDIEMTNLEELILERLPNLENVWNAYPKETNLELTFPQLNSLELCDLPKLKYDMFKLFTNLEYLRLGEHELKMILRGEFQGNHLHKLKVLALFFHIESNVFLQQVPNIEKLEVFDGSFKEIFRFDSLNVDEAGLLSQWKLLFLDSLPELVSIGSENSRIVPFLRNLETMEVISCFSSINLVPCAVSFSNLTYLQVESCNCLLYLFTSSTAKSLGQLKTMKIKRCDSIEKIISKEGDESHENEIIFQQLNCLKLEGLGKLRRFYKGSLRFPSLEELSVINCDRMKTFCAGTVKTDKDKLLEVKFERGVDAIPLETDLNSAMQNRWAFLAKATTPIC